MLTRLMPALYRRMRLGRLLRYPLGERLFLFAYFLYKRFFEDPFAALTRNHPELFKGGDILDIGANVGYTAVVFAAACSPGRRVWAFEPEPVSLVRLKRVIAGRELHSVIEPVHAAVGDHVGQASLCINDEHPADHWIGNDRGIGNDSHSITVPMTTIDAFIDDHHLTNVAFVKIDVQGYELFVSRGMERLLTMPVSVAFEISADSQTRFGYDSDELLDFYLARGYDLHLIAQNGTLKPAAAGDIEGILRRRGYADVLATRTRLGP